MSRTNLALFLFSSVLSWLFLEIFARVLFPYNSLTYRENDSHIFSQDCGHLKRPLQNVSVVETCYEISDIAFNKEGFRAVSSSPPVVERNPQMAANYGIAILGDSYMEAMQIPSGQETASLLQSTTGVPVFNTGIGGASLVKEYLIYNSIVKPLKPKYVIWFIYNGNDIVDSGCKSVERKINIDNSIHSEACGMVSNGTVSLTSPTERKELALPMEPVLAPAGFSQHVKYYCHSCTLVFELLRGAGLVRSGNEQSVSDAYQTGFQFYLPESAMDPETANEVRESWTVSEEMITRVNQDVTNNGGQLILVFIPELEQVATTWREDFRRTYLGYPNPAHDPQMVSKRLTAFANTKGIPSIDMLPLFKQYIQEKELGAPYLSWRCDAHWNPVGHRLAASVIARELVANYGLAVNEDPKTFVAKREAEMQMSPEQILGPQHFKDIYVRGIYRE